MAGVSELRLNSIQQRIADTGISGKLFAEGVAGTGKTASALRHVTALLSGRTPAHDITVIVPQPRLGHPFQLLDLDRARPAGMKLRVTTFGSIVRRAVDLFWPVVSEHLGHGIVREAPIFLNAESAQIQLGLVIDPMLELKRVFAGEHSVRLPRRRIYTQILDNLNKSALIGFPFDEIGSRLSDAWAGSDMQARMFEDVQTCATAFRQHCLQNGLLDYSLSVEAFRSHVWPLDSCRTWLTQHARHLVCDNVEEDTPAAHDLIIDLISSAESALVLFDRDASYRRFLGADEISAMRLRAHCRDSVVLEEPIRGKNPYQALISEFGTMFGRQFPSPEPTEDPLRNVVVRAYRYFPDMIDAICDAIVVLIESEGVDSSEIAVVTPFLSDSLRFALVNRFERRGIPIRTLRPSRPLGGEPSARCMLVLAQLAHPGWESTIGASDIAQALSQAISGLDPIRAFLLASTYRKATGLQSYIGLSETLRQRIPENIGQSYEVLREWLAQGQKRPDRPIDVLLAELYGEVLVHDGFRFAGDVDAGHVAAALVRSAREYRRLFERLKVKGNPQHYVRSVLDGLIGDQALSGPDADETSVGVQVAPAYTFLMNNQTVAYQFWLDIGSSGWSERLQQPLGQPFVLSRNWPVGKRWTAEDEALENAEFAFRLVAGLLRRCTGQVWLTHVEFNEQGFSQQGTLLVALQRIYRRRNVMGQGS